MKKVLVAVAWPYVNGNIHVGHLAGYLLPADVFARYQRLTGNDVLMVSGSDCHGTPITVQADKEGKSPEEVVEQYHKRDIELFSQYDLSYNLYTKTTTENHKRVVQDLFLDLLKEGVIVKDTMKQYFSSEDQQFLPDRYVEGKCPHCGAEEQRSDQCENCGRWLSDGELLNPVSKLTGAKVELKDTEHYFLDFENEELNKKLKEYIESKKGEWRGWVWKEASGWLKEGLKKRAITRDMDWAIELPIERIKELPEDKQLKSFEGKKIYVWFEAVIGYLSAPQEWAQLVENLNEDTKEIDSEKILSYYKGQSKDWEDWWLNQDSRHYYFMGQDNLVFHTLMWPGELIGSSTEYKLPDNVVVNKFMNFNNAKFSKSRDNIIDSREIAEKYGTDAVRYFILSNLPENKESNFTWERFIDANNNELVANLGNFINRTLVFYSRNKDIVKGEVSENVKAEINKAYKNIAEHMERVEIVDSIGEIMILSSFGNKYFNDSEIWKVIKEDKDRASQLMLDLINIVEAIRNIIRPFLPEAYKTLTEMLGLDIEVETVGKDLWEFKGIKEFSNLGEVKPLFQKIEKVENE